MIRWKPPLALALVALVPQAQTAQGQIAASHVYHNHMPNFWPYYDVTQYATTPVGAPIRYTYDGPRQRPHGQVRGLDAPPLQQHLRHLHVRV